jgi:hypothetical protein
MAMQAVEPIATLGLWVEMGFALSASRVKVKKITKLT